MKTYIFTFQTNFGLGITIIRANSLKEAKSYADKDNQTWDDYDVHCLEDLPQKVGICFQRT